MVIAWQLIGCAGGVRGATQEENEWLQWKRKAVCLEKQEKAVCLVQVLGQRIFCYFRQKSPLLFMICFSVVNPTKRWEKTKKESSIVWCDLHSGEKEDTLPGSAVTWIWIHLTSCLPLFWFLGTAPLPLFMCLCSPGSCWIQTHTGEQMLFFQ